MMAHLFTLAGAAHFRKVAVSISQHADHFLPDSEPLSCIRKTTAGYRACIGLISNNSAVDEYSD